MNIFNTKYISLFEPYNGVEYIYSILENIGHSKDFTTKEARRDGLRVIYELFELGLLEIFNWGEYEDKLKHKYLSNNEKMIYIQELWFLGADFCDFHQMPMFKFKDWYIKKLEKIGISHTTDWVSFVNTKIVDLEKWIEINKPSEN